MGSPRILLVDIETKPIVALIWSLRQKYIPPEMILEDWGIIAWAAKWLGEKEVFYEDTRKKEEKTCLRRLWGLLDDADVVIWHNGDHFDGPKLNTRFKFLGYKPYSPVRSVDTKKLFCRVFGESSNSLAFLSEKYNKRYKKLKHAKFPGNDLWKECRLGNPEAWDEMEKYNIHDVLALEELYVQAAPWDYTDFFIYGDDIRCKCGSEEFQKRGFAYTRQRKFQRYQCNECGHWWRDTKSTRSVSVAGVVR